MAGCYPEVILNVPLGHLGYLLHVKRIARSSPITIQPSSETPPMVGVRFSSLGREQCYLLRLSRNHFGSPHLPLDRAHHQSLGGSIKKRPSETEFPFSVANRNGFPGLTNGHSMTDDDLK